MAMQSNIGDSGRNGRRDTFFGLQDFHRKYGRFAIGNEEAREGNRKSLLLAREANMRNLKRILPISLSHDQQKHHGDDYDSKDKDRCTGRSSSNNNIRGHNTLIEADTSKVLGGRQLACRHLRPTNSMSSLSCLSLVSWGDLGEELDRAVLNSLHDGGNSGTTATDSSKKTVEDVDGKVLEKISHSQGHRVSVEVRSSIDRGTWKEASRSHMLINRMSSLSCPSLVSWGDLGEEIDQAVLNSLHDAGNSGTAAKTSGKDVGGKVLDMINNIQGHRVSFELCSSIDQSVRKMASRNKILMNGMPSLSCPSLVSWGDLDEELDRAVVNSLHDTGNIDTAANTSGDVDSKVLDMISRIQGHRVSFEVRSSIDQSMRKVASKNQMLTMGMPTLSYPSLVSWGELGEELHRAVINSLHDTGNIGSAAMTSGMDVDGQVLDMINHIQGHRVSFEVRSSINQSMRKVASRSKMLTNRMSSLSCPSLVSWGDLGEEIDQAVLNSVHDAGNSGKTGKTSGMDVDGQVLDISGHIQGHRVSFEFRASIDQSTRQVVRRSCMPTNCMPSLSSPSLESWGDCGKELDRAVLNSLCYAGSSDMIAKGSFEKVCCCPKVDVDVWALDEISCIQGHHESYESCTSVDLGVRRPAIRHQKPVKRLSSSSLSCPLFAKGHHLWADRDAPSCIGSRSKLRQSSSCPSIGDTSFSENDMVLATKLSLGLYNLVNDDGNHPNALKNQPTLRTAMGSMLNEKEKGRIESRSGSKVVEFVAEPAPNLDRLMWRHANRRLTEGRRVQNSSDDVNDRHARRRTRG